MMRFDSFASYNDLIKVSGKTLQDMTLTERNLFIENERLKLSYANLSREKEELAISLLSEIERLEHENEALEKRSKFRVVK